MPIPNLVHAVWVGGNPLPDKERTLFRLNRRLLTNVGFEYILWKEDEIDHLLPKSSIFRNFYDYCMERKRFAFASDIVKMFILCTKGGWISDADNEFLKPPTAFSGLNWVSGFENYNGAINPITAVMGATPNHLFSRALLHTYENNKFEVMVSMPNTRWISQYLLNHGGNRENIRFYSKHFDVDIFPSDYFCGPELTENTVSLHHFSGSWLNED